MKKRGRSGLLDLRPLRGPPRGKESLNEEDESNEENYSSEEKRGNEYHELAWAEPAPAEEGVGRVAGGRARDWRRMSLGQIRIR